MSAIQAIRRRRGFSLVELLVVIAIIAVLASLLLPAINRGKMRAKQIGCVNNLRQVGVAFQNFAHDHNSLFPMAVPADSGGSQEFTLASLQAGGEFYFSFRHFQTLSNELVSPKVLACPSDTRQPAASFISFDNKSLSYFVGLRADFSRPYSILAGDRNLTNDFARMPTLLRPTLNRGWRWTAELHQFKGNLLFSDVHVEEKSTKTLSASLEQSTGGELALPDLPHNPATVPVQAFSAVPVPSARSTLQPEHRPAPPAAPDPAGSQKQPSKPQGLLQSVPVALPSSFSVSMSPQTQSATNPDKQITRPPVPASPAQKPSSVEEPGFSFFPAWVGGAMTDFFKFALWLLCLLVFLLLTTILVLRGRALGHKSRKNTN